MKLIPKVIEAKPDDFAFDESEELEPYSPEAQKVIDAGGEPDEKRRVTPLGRVKQSSRGAVQRGHVFMPAVYDTEANKIVHAPPVFFTTEFYAHRRAARYIRAFEKTGKFTGVTSVIAGPAVVNAG